MESKCRVLEVKDVVECNSARREIIKARQRKMTRVVDSTHSQAVQFFCSLPVGPPVVFAGFGGSYPKMARLFCFATPDRPVCPAVRRTARGQEPRYSPVTEFIRIMLSQVAIKIGRYSSNADVVSLDAKFRGISPQFRFLEMQPSVVNGV